MGSLAFFDVPSLVRTHGLRHFVETGTGVGATVDHVLRAWPDVRCARTCEIMPELAAQARAKYARSPKVRVFHGPSEHFLRAVCCVLPHDEPILFWLDAHFPGADYRLRGYGDEADEAVRLPLETELRVIAEERPLGRDVIAIDDLRIYTDGGFGSGDTPEELRPFCAVHRGIGFAHDLMGRTHDVSTYREHEGYVLLTPKETQDG